MKHLRWLLIFVPLAFLAEFVLHAELLVFIFSALGLIPLAGLLGEATEQLAVRTGPKLGGLLNATLGNAAELIITIVALQAGKIDLVKASITGSILGNLLLILGFSLLVGGMRHGIQKFDRGMAGLSSTMMFVSVIGMLIPTIFEVIREIYRGEALHFNADIQDPALQTLSLWVAGSLIFIYGLSLLYSFRSPADDREIRERASAGHGKETWSTRLAGAVLALSTLAIVFLSEFLIGAVEPVVRQIGVSETFLGIILIPLVGNVAEHLVGVQMAWKNKMDLSLAISFGSSMQIALLVAPALVFISLFFDNPMSLFFNPFEVAVLGVAVAIAEMLASDGESNWLEGAQLLVVYVIAAVGFYLI